MLRLGGNTDELRMRVVAEFEKRRSIDEIAAFLPTVYRGGNGFTIDGVKYAVWYTEDGIRVAQGEQAQYERAQLIPWSDAAVRIGELLDAGRFATKGEVAGAEDYERELIAQMSRLCDRDTSSVNEKSQPRRSTNPSPGAASYTATDSNSSIPAENKDVNSKVRHPGRRV